MLDLAKLWIPLIIVIIGALILILGAVGLAMRRKAA
jgi:hypothetical protein